MSILSKALDWVADWQHRKRAEQITYRDRVANEEAGYVAPGDELDAEASFRDRADARANLARNESLHRAAQWYDADIVGQTLLEQDGQVPNQHDRDVYWASRGAAELDAGRDLSVEERDEHRHPYTDASLTADRAPDPVTARLVEQARDLVAECTWKEDPADPADLTDDEVREGVDRHYGGGRAQFTRDADPPVRVEDAQWRPGNAEASGDPSTAAARRDDLAREIENARAACDRATAAEPAAAPPAVDTATTQQRAPVHRAYASDV